MAGSDFFRAAAARASSTTSGVTCAGCMIIIVQSQLDLSPVVKAVMSGPPQPLERHHAVVQAVRRPLQREPCRVGHREERLHRLDVLGRFVRVTMAVDHGELQLGHLDERASRLAL